MAGRPAVFATNRPDVIVVGAGSAGATLAATLARDPARRVLLLESGGRPLPLLHSLPIMAGILPSADIALWRDRTAPEAMLAGRSLPWPHGRVLGGSSAINGMVWMRGRPSDYERWKRAGADGWGWEDVRPAFEALDGLDSGGAGLVPVERHPATNPLFDAFIAAGRAAGHGLSRDFNAAPHEGVGRYSVNIAHARRMSAARIFLRHPPPNLTILTGATMLCLLLRGGRIEGVRVSLRGQVGNFTAGETVLCAGAVNTPKLLMLSGIGPAQALQAAGISVRHDLPGVGENLQDHICGRLAHECLQPVTLRNLTRTDRALRAGLEALFFGRGEAGLTPFGAGVLLRSTPELAEPDIQGFLIPGLSDYGLWFPGIRPARRGHGFIASVYQLRPESRGRITLASADPAAPPVIAPAYLQARRDRETLRQGMQRMAEILEQPEMAAFRGRRLSLTDPYDAAGFEQALAQEATTAFHAVGTCRIGRADDPMAVVTAELSLLGLAGLRIADASVMPFLTSGNTNAPAMMIGLRCATMMT